MLSAIARLLKQRGTYDLALLEPSCARRRVAARARAAGCEDLRAYLQLLERDPGEVSRLRRSLHITVSSFFRDPGTFRVLESMVLPEIFRVKAQQRDRRVRIVSAGCATGEEPYSVAIVLLTNFAEELGQFQVTVLGLDAEGEAIRTAEVGVYAPSQVEPVPQALRKRYFEDAEGGMLRVHEEVAALVSFERRDLSRRLPWSNIDLLVCRNTLIYMGPEDKAEVIRRFADAISPAGYLVLGRAEVLPQAARPFFTCVAIPERVYRKR